MPTSFPHRAGRMQLCQFAPAQGRSKRNALLCAQHELPAPFSRVHSKPASGRDTKRVAGLVEPQGCLCGLLYGALLHDSGYFADVQHLARDTTRRVATGSFGKSPYLNRSAK
jgi:hypothetical protein